MLTTMILTICIDGARGVGGITGSSGHRAVDHVEEGFEHGIERARVLTQIPAQSRVAIRV